MIKLGSKKIKLLFLTLLNLAATLTAGVPLETETATTLKKGGFEGNMALEYQTSSEGKEVAIPVALEYGLLDNLEILLEPVLYTAILPNTGKSTLGLGDLEVTLNYRFYTQTGVLPSFGVAGEAKIPTARKTLIGTGEFDYTGYLIASKAFSQCMLHANLGYAIVGQPLGQNLSDLISYFVAVEQSAGKAVQFMGEFYGNFPATGEAIGTENAASPESAGGNFVGMVGMRYFLFSNTAMTLGVSYDNSNAIQIAPGLFYSFR